MFWTECPVFRRDSWQRLSVHLLQDVLDILQFLSQSRGIQVRQRVHGP